MGSHVANSTSFKPGDKAAKKNPKVIYKLFYRMAENAINDENILCFQDACLSINCRSSKIEYWVNKNPIFEKYKKDIQNIIISRINKNALKNKFNSTASIWRMKQLGESDSNTINHTSSDGTMTPKNIITTLTPDELKKALAK